MPSLSASPPPASDKPTFANLLARRKKYTELARCKIAELLETERTYVQKVRGQLSLALV